MKLLKLKRSLKEGWTVFIRNSWLSVATISVLFLSLYIVGSTLLIGMVARELVDNIEKNVNISVYFKPDVSEERINQIKDEIKKEGKVYSIDYISKDQALEKFSSENKDDPVIAGALKEIGENPLLSSLVIRANNQADYSRLAEEIENKYKDDINNINYGKNKDVIEKLDKITSSAKKVGLILGIVFVAIAILITFNTIRLSLFVRRKEFDIMRLVGASNLYIKAPSIFEGMFYGAFSSILAILAVVATAYTAMPMVIKGLITKDQIVKFYLNNLVFIGGVIFAVGLLIGIISSMIAIKKYLKA